MRWPEIEEFLLSFPDTVAAISWGMPGVKTGGRLVAWWRDRQDSPGALAFKVDPAEREALLRDPDLPYFTNDHLERFDSPVVLVRPEDVDDDELREMLTEAWLVTAKPRVRRAWLEQSEGDR